MSAGDRRWTFALWALALVLPLGILLQPWVFPGRTRWPAVQRQLHSPLVLVTVAGLRADRVHHLGYARETTPVLDTIAHQGISFAGSYSSSNESLATAAALMTSRCPEVTGVHGPGDRLPPGPATLAERLSDKGYRCIALLSDPDLRDAGLERGFARYEVVDGPVTADEMFALAMAAIDEAPSGNWFVWVDLPDLQRPYGGIGFDGAPFARGMPAGFGDGPPVVEHLGAADVVARGWDDREPRWLSDRYDSALFAMDAALGRFLDELTEAFLLETMTLCVTGTRGERLDDRPGIAFTHGIDLYEHSVRVPLLLRLPARHIRGLTLNRLAHSVDFAPTMLELVARIPDGPASWPSASGRSLAQGTRFQGTGSPRVHIEGHHRQHDTIAHAIVTIASGTRFKLIRSANDRQREFYIVSDDIGERNDLAQRQAPRADVLSRYVDTWRETCTIR